MGISDDERRQHDMLHRFAPLAAICMLVPTGVTGVALADPPADPAVAPAADAGPPPDNGAVPSEVPGIAHTPDGRTLTVAAKDETQLPVAPLTTSLSSREWLVGATFTGSGMGSVNGGTLEVGYQIGCGIEMDKVKLNGSIGLGLGTASFGAAGLTGLGALTVPIQGQVEVKIEDPKLCARYAAALLRGVKIGPAPGRMQRRLSYAGMRPINNIVDVTNYVMLEWGQPLHAFDYDVLKRRAGGKAPTIIVRPARSARTEGARCLSRNDFGRLSESVRRIWHFERR